MLATGMHRARGSDRGVRRKYCLARTFMAGPSSKICGAKRVHTKGVLKDGVVRVQAGMKPSRG